MNRRFALAGLLRLRHLEQDQAAGQLGAAHARAAEVNRRRQAFRAELADEAADAATAEALLAVSASRSASRSLLAELDLLVQSSASETDRAQAAFNAVRAKSVALEKLEDKHRGLLAEEDLRGQQNVLDEIASAAWHRRDNGVNA